MLSWLDRDDLEPVSGCTFVDRENPLQFRVGTQHIAKGVHTTVDLGGIRSRIKMVKSGSWVAPNAVATVGYHNER
jgi:hypothetical protein